MDEDDGSQGALSLCRGDWTMAFDIWDLWDLDIVHQVKHSKPIPLKRSFLVPYIVLNSDSSSTI